MHLHRFSCFTYSPNWTQRFEGRLHQRNVNEERTIWPNVNHISILRLNLCRNLDRSNKLKAEHQIFLIACVTESFTLKIMFKLIRFVNIANGLKNSSIVSKNFARRSFCNAFRLPRTETSKFHHNCWANFEIEVNFVLKCIPAINSIQLLGRTAKYPEHKGTGAKPVIMFDVATHTNYKYLNGIIGRSKFQTIISFSKNRTENGDWNQRVDWHQVVVFRPVIIKSVLQHFLKGQRILVDGKLSYGEMKNEDGDIRPLVSIVAHKIFFFS